jgi:hypothetical protein
MWAFTVCAAITVSGGAVVAVARDRRFGPAAGADVPSLHVYRPDSTTMSAMICRAETGASGPEPFTADAGGTTIKTRALAPTMKGDVSSFLAKQDVREGVDDILSAVEAALPGYQTLLEVVKNPDDDAEDAFLMVNVVMREDDAQAWASVEAVIDQEWLQLPPHVRGAMGVGRELIPVG